jgi:hypothetical protein
MRLLSAALLLVALGCGSDKVTGPPTAASVAGRYSLKTVNGAPLPFLLGQVGTSKTEVMADVLALSANGTFLQTSTIRTTVDGVASTSSASEPGKFTMSGSTATFVFDVDGSYGTGTIDDRTLTISGNGFVTIYAKE